VGHVHSAGICGPDAGIGEAYTLNGILAEKLVVGHQIEKKDATIYSSATLPNSASFWVTVSKTAHPMLLDR